MAEPLTEPTVIANPTSVAENMEAMATDTTAKYENGRVLIPQSTSSRSLNVVQVDDREIAGSQFIGQPEYNIQASANQRAYSSVVRSEYLPNLSKNAGTTYTLGKVADYISLYTGFRSDYVADNYDRMVAKLYPNSNPDPKNILDNFRTIAANSRLLLDQWQMATTIADGYDTSEKRAFIESAYRNLMAEEDFVHLMPEGTFKRRWEERLYALPKQHWLNIEGWKAQNKGYIIAGSIAAMAAIVAIASGGILAAPAVAGSTAALSASVGGSAMATATLGGALATEAGLLTLTAFQTVGKFGGMASSYDFYRDIMIGSNYLEMEQRIKAEGLDVSQDMMKQAARINGSLVAGISAAEQVVSAGFIRGGNPLTNAMRQVQSDPRFWNLLGGALIKKAKHLGKTLAMENILEVTEEATEYLLTEANFKAWGSETHHSMTNDEWADTVRMIVRDTSMNVMAMGVGAGSVGAIMDASTTYMNSKTSDMPILSREGKRILNSLPSMEQFTFEQDSRGNVSIKDANGELIDIEGKKVFDSVVGDSDIMVYISPAQRAIMAEYVRRNPEAAMRSSGLSKITGLSESELDGMATGASSPVSPENNFVNFYRRVTMGNPDLEVNGEQLVVDTGNGPVGIQISAEGENATIEVYEENTDSHAVVDAKIGRNGTLVLGGIKESTFENNAQIMTAINSAINMEYLFMNEYNFPAEYTAEVRQLQKILDGDIENLSKQDLNLIATAAEVLIEKMGPRKNVPEEKLVSRQVPNIVVEDVDVWVEEDVTEDEVTYTTPSTYDGLEEKRHKNLQREIQSEERKLEAFEVFQKSNREYIEKNQEDMAYLQGKIDELEAEKASNPDFNRQSEIDGLKARMEGQAVSDETLEIADKIATRIDEANKKLEGLRAEEAKYQEAFEAAQKEYQEPEAINADVFVDNYIQSVLSALDQIEITDSNREYVSRIRESMNLMKERMEKFKDIIYGSDVMYDGSQASGVEVYKGDQILHENTRDEMQRLLTNLKEGIIDSVEYDKKIKALHNTVVERIKERRREAYENIMDGHKGEYNIKDLIEIEKDLRELTGQLLNDELKAPSRESNVTKAFLISREYEYDQYAEQIWEVLNEHWNDKGYGNYNRSDKMMKILNDYYNELPLDLQKLFPDGMNDEAFHAFNSYRAGINEAIHNINAYGIVEMESMIAPWERVQGFKDFPDMMAGKKTEREGGYTTTEGRVENITEVKKKRTVKKRERRESVEYVEKQVPRQEDPNGPVRDNLETMLQQASETREQALEEINKMIRIIALLDANIASSQMRERVNQLAAQYNFHSERSMIEGKILSDMEREGLSPSDFDNIVQMSKKSLEAIPIKELRSLYSAMLRAAKTDLKITGMQIGDSIIPFKDVIALAINEAKGLNTAERPKAAVKNPLPKGFHRFYDQMLHYDLIIEKVFGKQSVIYKTLFSNIHKQDTKRNGYVHDMKERIVKNYERIAERAGMKGKDYMGEVIIKFSNGVRFTKEDLLSVLQHLRSGEENYRGSGMTYNEFALRQNGLTMRNVFTGAPVSLTHTQMNKIINIAKNYQLSDADTMAINEFQNIMDKLHLLTDTRYQQLYGKPMPKTRFHMRISPDRSFDAPSVKGIISDVSNTENVKLIFDASSTYEREGVTRPIELVKLGDELIHSLDAASRFAYTDNAFEQAGMMIANPAVRNELEQRFGSHYPTIIVEGLKHWAGQRPPRRPITQLIDFIRMKSSQSILSLNPEIAMKQLTSLPAFAPYVDAKYLFDSNAQIMKDKNAVDLILSTWSPRYRMRRETMGNHEALATMKRREGRTLTRGSSTYDKIGYWMMRGVDTTAVRIGMYGAMNQFNAEVERGYFSDTVKDALDIDNDIIAIMTPEVRMQKAAEFAEYVLDRTQPVNDPQYTSQMRREGAFLRTYAMFSSFTEQMANLIDRTYSALRRGDQGALSTFIGTMVMVMGVIPSMTAAFDTIRKNAWDKYTRDEDDKDEPWYGLYFENYIKNASGYWYGIKDVASFGLSFKKYGTSKYAFNETPIKEVSELSLNGIAFLMKSMNANNSEQVRIRALENATNNALDLSLMMVGFSTYPKKVIERTIERNENK